MLPTTDITEDPGYNAVPDILPHRDRERIQPSPGSLLDEIMESEGVVCALPGERALGHAWDSLVLKHHYYYQVLSEHWDMLMWINRSIFSYFELLGTQVLQRNILVEISFSVPINMYCQLLHVHVAVHEVVFLCSMQQY